jgi:hypothetical protein
LSIGERSEVSRQQSGGRRRRPLPENHLTGDSIVNRESSIVISGPMLREAKPCFFRL